MDDGNLFCQSITVRKFFNAEEFSKQNFWSVKDQKGADAKTKIRCQKIIWQNWGLQNKYEFLSCQ